MSILLHVSTVITGPEGILMVREAKPSIHGLWNLPGGRIEQEESAGEAAVREVREETGLRIGLNGFLGLYSSITADERILRFVFTAELSDAVAHAGDEILEIAWFPPDRLIRIRNEELAGADMLRRILRDAIARPPAPIYTVDEWRSW